MPKRRLKKWVKVVLIVIGLLILVNHYVWYMNDLKVRSNEIDQLAGDK